MKRALFVALLLVLSAGAFAQGQSRLRLGFKAGPTLSDYLAGTSNMLEWRKQKVGHFGLFYCIPVTPTVFQIQPELQYSMKGANQYRRLWDEESPFVKFYAMRQHYLELPVMAVFRAKWFYFEVGPSASVLLKARVTVEPVASSIAGQSGDATDAIGRFSYGGAAGMGIMTPNGLMLGVRYGADIKDLSIASGRNPNAWKGIHNSVIQLSAGWLISGRPGANITIPK